MSEDEFLKIFCSYSREDLKYRENLGKHLHSLTRQKPIKFWHDFQIVAGTDWNAQIRSHLETADIILLLISADFTSSDYCYCEEMYRAMRRHNLGDACVIPIVVRPVRLEGLPFTQLQCLPRYAQPVSRWEDQDEAWVNIVDEINNVIKNLNEERKQKNFSAKTGNKDALKQDARDTSHSFALLMDAENTTIHPKEENNKVAMPLIVTERNIDARAQRLKHIARQLNVTREEIDAAIEETEKWLKEHEDNTNIRQTYLTLIEKRGTSEQVQQVLEAIERWLEAYEDNTNIRQAYLTLVEKRGTSEQIQQALETTEHWLETHNSDKYNSNNMNVRAQYIILVKQRASEEKAKKTIEKIESWIDQNKKDESVIVAYLGLVEEYGTKEQLQEAISNAERWHKSFKAKSNRIEGKLVKLRQQLKAGRQFQGNLNKTRDVEGFPLYTADKKVQYLSQLTRNGNQEMCVVAIEEVRAWLKKHDDDTNTYQAYLRLVRERGTEEQIRRALKEVVSWLKQDKYYRKVNVREAYLRLVRKKGTVVELQEAIKDTEVFLQYCNNADIRNAYSGLNRELVRRRRRSTLENTKVSL